MVRTPEPDVGVTSRKLSEAWFGIGEPARVDVNTPCSRVGSGAGGAEAPLPWEGQVSSERGGGGRACNGAHALASTRSTLC